MAKNKMKSHRGACKRMKVTGSEKSKEKQGVQEPYTDKEEP